MKTNTCMGKMGPGVENEDLMSLVEIDGDKG